ncbi:MAG TPA: PilT/PilU family type 4a pilus ATPase [Tepidisphaeraceae bacterium]|jgi:twitching motility protein PilT|nr:PilT/PilU family type 4a pilus ATPase [Tepidisphaeraceae bacterium]
MAASLDQILRASREQFASDIHLVRGIAPAFRVNGDIRIAKGEALDEPQLRALVDQLLTEKQQKTFADELQLCFSRHWPGLGRFRASLYFHGGCPEMAIRVSEAHIRPRSELRLPTIVDELTRRPGGLILITGATGVGKTTTLNYMVDLINRERRAKIITIEDPVEYTHENRNSIVIQQEVHTDTPSFGKALIHVLRQDPDVIAVGEMRDTETIATALTAAETGHLVLATLHTPDAVQTVQRMLGAFPAEQQSNIAYQIAGSLQAIIAQNLLPRADGKGQVLACEICIATGAIRKMIRDGESHLMTNEIQMGRKFQMQTMDVALLELYQQGEISYDTAVSCAKDPNSFKHKIA